MSKDFNPANRGQQNPIVELSRVNTYDIVILFISKKKKVEITLPLLVNIVLCKSRLICVR